MPAFIDITGQRFGRLVVLGLANRNRHRQTCWHCRCDCGTSNIVVGVALKTGHTQSCGCSRRDLPHPIGKADHPRLYECWLSMRKRCYYEGYHGREFYQGIEVCPAWRDSFPPFRDWALANGYADDLTLDRIDSDGNYEPGNCRWVSQSVQAYFANLQAQKASRS